ncbi:DUF2199 domain-containing protein [Couchioplanes caeruleus]|uniref:DUF2199 domain-containing protein n=1 Tax=Couchioplanes caeruleus TaxID=56438 RepID=UPI0020BD6450|nr:DUF2199 domain-containing protein [Couchioplanes caeruleus]UQU61304.1 DUF2199 domain-containing protein [Couchioplanes caeruleus]
MSNEGSFTCGRCAELHPGPPMSYGPPAPAYWSAELAADPDNVLEGEICVIRGQGFFVRGLIELPVTGTGETFAWSVWVSQSEESFRDIVAAWDRPGRESRAPSFGWLSTQLPYDPPTLNLKTRLHTRPVGERPWVELEPTDHPLAVEQRTGITTARIQEIAERMRHGG